VICGGSHMAAVGVLPTQTFPVLVARRFREAATFGRVRTVFYTGDPRGLGLQDLANPNGFVLVVLPRNMYGVPLPHHLTLVLARLRGRRLTLDDLGRRAPVPPAPTGPAQGEQAPPPRGPSRLRAGVRWLTAMAVAVACLPALPFTLALYGRRLDSALTEASSYGCNQVVLTTPIPLSWRRYPGASWYQAGLAWLLRRRAREGVVVADAFRRLHRLADARRTLPDDPLHLTPEGHRALAEEISLALAGLETAR
jgi:lysophospholipase L1-like esterase